MQISSWTTCAYGPAAAGGAGTCASHGVHVPASAADSCLVVEIVTSLSTHVASYYFRSRLDQLSSVLESVSCTSKAKTLRVGSTRAHLLLPLRVFAERGDGQYEPRAAAGGLAVTNH